MGNSQTKESRPPGSPSHRHGHRGGSPSDYVRSPYRDGARSGRNSRPDLSFLGIGPAPERDVAHLEHRREIKQDREARRLERERIARLKERERSMKEEHVDGGYLVTQGVYVGVEDYNKAVVRQLMIERRIAPFWRGLNDFSESWTEHQLVAAARGLPIPSADEIPPELEYKLSPNSADNPENVSPAATTTILNVPITSPTLSLPSDISLSPPPATGPAHSLPSLSPIASGTSASPLFRGRAKTLAALATSSKASSQTDLAPRETMLPHDPFVNGQPIEAYLYKDASECPICFLYYPPYLNRTRCCDQPICSECFVQIKRPDPHPPEHGEGAAPSSPNPDSPAATAPTMNGEQQANNEEDWQLVSEPSSCPFCVQPEFGVTYTPPPFRRGLTYASPNGLRVGFAPSALSSTSSLSSIPTTQVNGGRRRATSLSANDPSVITTDKVRPDWAQKLANARAHAARRSAAATALHTAAYLMNGSGSGESRGFSGRRSMLRRAGGTGSGSQSPGGRTGGSPALHALAFLSDRRVVVDGDANGDDGSTTLVPPRGSSRRSRIDDLEEMMMMEAIRMSLASEEERRRKEEKEARKEAKRKEKEARKAEKVARKTGIYSSNSSFAALPVPSTSGPGRLMSSSSSMTMEESPAKGKGVERVAPSMDASAANSDAETGPSGTTRQPFATRIDDDLSFPPQQSSPSDPPRPSHLRHMSTASSGSSSLGESVSGEQIGNGTPGNGSSSALESLFNFRSLAEVIGDEEKRAGSAEHVEEPIPELKSVEGPSEELKKDGQEIEANAAGASGATAKSEDQDREDLSAEVHSTTEDGATFVPKELTTNSVEVTNAGETTS